MHASTTRKGLKLETPATYRIRVQGHLDDTWADRLGGMAITPEVQLLINPTLNPEENTIWVFGLRARLAL